MKSLVFLLFSLASLVGCSSDEDSGSLMQNLAPVLSVILPDSFVQAQTYEIEIIYKRPTNCHSFRDLIFLKMRMRFLLEW